MKRLRLFFKEKQNTIRKFTTTANIVFGFLKIILAILSRSVLVFIYSFYNISMSVAKRTTVVDENENKKKKYFMCGVIVIISSICYMLYSTYIYFNGSNAKYHMYVAIGIAALTFYNIFSAIIGVIISRRKEDIQREMINQTNFASALISLSLTQTAILSFTTTADMSKYNAICGIIFGFFSLIIGIYMIFYIKRK